MFKKIFFVFVLFNILIANALAKKPLEDHSPLRIAMLMSSGQLEHAQAALENAKSKYTQYIAAWSGILDQRNAHKNNVSSLGACADVTDCKTLYSHALRSDKLIDAAAYLESAYRQASTSEQAAMLGELADVQFNARNYVSAAKYYDELKSRGLPHLDLTMRLAQSYGRSDQFDAAINIYQQIYDEKNTAEILYKLAFLNEDKGDYAQSNKLYRQLLSDYPSSSYVKTAQEKIFWNEYRGGNFAAALTQTKLLSGPDFDYWLARTYEKMGKKNEAKNLYHNIINSRGKTYYGALANLRLIVSKKKAPLDINPNVKWSGIPHYKLVKSENPFGPDLLPAILAGKWIELSSSLANAVDDAVNFAANGSINEKYPDAYAKWVSYFANINGIKPALAWAIMREESHFRPSVVSPANAIGLMQIIPQTVSEIAGDLLRTNITNSDMKKPLHAIEFGTYYLGKLYARWGNHLIYTIASYNAGPNAVARWISSKGALEWDEWVEAIPYTETRNYVKKVLVSYWHYQNLYQ